MIFPSVLLDYWRVILQGIMMNGDSCPGDRLYSNYAEHVDRRHSARGTE